MDEWQLVMFAKVAARCKVKVVTDGLSAEVLRRCSVEPARSVEEAVAELLAWLHWLESGAHEEPVHGAHTVAEDVTDVVATDVAGGPAAR